MLASLILAIAFIVIVGFVIYSISDEIDRANELDSIVEERGEELDDDFLIEVLLVESKLDRYPKWLRKIVENVK